MDVVKLTPSHLAVLEDRHLKTERIRTLIVGGEDLRADLARSVYDSAGDDLAIFNEYGPTEATVGCMIHRFDPHVDTIGSVPIGRPVANSRVYLLDGGLAHVPVGQVGELYVAGGYLNQAKLTARGVIADPFRPDERMYRTGDLARWRSPGVMEFVGRTDDQIKVRGYRIELGEIEAVLIESEAVANAAVAVREPSPGDIRLVAYYVADPGVGANVTQLRQHLRDRLPDHMVPRPRASRRPPTHHQRQARPPGVAGGHRRGGDFDRLPGASHPPGAARRPSVRRAAGRRAGQRRRQLLRAGRALDSRHAADCPPPRGDRRPIEPADDPSQHPIPGRRPATRDDVY